MYNHIAIKAIFDVKPTPDKYYGWEHYSGKNYDISFRKEFFIVMDHLDEFKYEYAFNYDGEYVGVREEISASGIDDGYWITLSKDISYDIDILCYKTPTKLIKVHYHKADDPFYEEGQIKQPGSYKDPDKRKVDIGSVGKKEVYILPNGRVISIKKYDKLKKRGKI